jgi:hypothetical protein
MAIVSLDAFMILSVASSINNKLNDAAKQMELVAFQMADMMSALFQCVTQALVSEYSH